MRFSEEMSFPHPVLAPWLTDYEEAAFTIRLLHRESLKGGKLAIVCEASITQPDIVTLIESGCAIFGVFVNCESTSMRKLVPLGFPTGSHEFGPGALLNRVAFRPVVWTTEHLENWAPVGANPEFGDAIAVPKGEILALGFEQTIDVSRAKMAPLETIFALRAVDSLADGEIEVDLERAKITILTSSKTYGTINEWRESQASSVVMGAVYIPALMQVLDTLREGTGSYENFRWYRPFIDRCATLEIEFDNVDLLKASAKLLDYPLTRLPPATDYNP
jgi:hypothetical protein